MANEVNISDYAVRTFMNSVELFKDCYMQVIIEIYMEKLLWIYSVNYNIDKFIGSLFVPYTYGSYMGTKIRVKMIMVFLYSSTILI